MIPLRVLTVVAVCLLLQACTTLVRTPSSSVPDTPEAARAAWARVLERFVDDDGYVDFAALRDDRTDLDRYVAFVAATPAETFAPGAPRLAHYLDSYNALSMFNVIESGIPRTHAGIAKLRFFVLREHTIGGRPLSLYRYESDVIRPIGDPRVHFALNCSAVSCPRLPRVPFGVGDLEARLDAETRAFFAQPRHLRIDPQAQRVHVSALLDFYTADFVPRHAPSLLAWVARYTSEALPVDWPVVFEPYDWTIANRPGIAQPR
jgi:hypothetical protein